MNTSGIAGVQKGGRIVMYALQHLRADLFLGLRRLVSNSFCTGLWDGSIYGNNNTVYGCSGVQKSN